MIHKIARRKWERDGKAKKKKKATSTITSKVKKKSKIVYKKLVFKK